MYELLKAALDVLVKAVTGLAGRRKESRLQELSVELFALLAVAYEIVNRGEQIVVLMRKAEPMAAAKSTTPVSVQNWQRRLVDHMRDQFNALDEYNGLAHQFSRLTGVISPDGFYGVDFGLWLKEARLRDIESMIWDAATHGSVGLNLGVRKRPEGEHGWNSNIDGLDKIPQTTVAAIGNYLEHMKPEEQLASVRESLAIIRGALNEHFSLTDMLLGLQARTPRPRNHPASISGTETRTQRINRLMKKETDTEITPPLRTSAIPDSVWYAAYGPNMGFGELINYLNNGWQSVELWPARSSSVMLPGRLYFACESQAWTTGIPFYDPQATGTTAARLYLLNIGQFSDLAAKIMNKLPGEDLDITEVLTTGRQEIGPGRYETLVNPAQLDGFPVLAFTASWSLGDITPKLPAERYIRHLAWGLAETHGWSSSKIATYLADCPGIAGEWSVADVERIIPSNLGIPSDLGTDD